MTDYVKLLDEYVQSKKESGELLGIHINPPENFKATDEQMQRTAKAVYETLTGVRKSVETTRERW